MATLVDTNVLLRLLQPEHPGANLVEFWAAATRPVAENGLGMSPLMATGELRVLRDLFRLFVGKVGGSGGLGENSSPATWFR